MATRKDTKKGFDDNFLYNSMLARALVQLFPETERRKIHAWLDKLQRVSVRSVGTSSEVERLNVRNEYMWLLLLVMQSGSLTVPFNEVPPDGTELPPIFEIMPARIYHEVLGSSEQNFSWVDKVLLNPSVVCEKSSESRSGLAPHAFLDQQPRPLNGIACYFSVFSNKS